MTGDGAVKEYMNARITHLMAPVVTAENNDCCGLIDPMGSCYDGETLDVLNYRIWQITLTAEDPSGCGLGNNGNDIEVVEDYTEQL